MPTLDTCYSSLYFPYTGTFDLRKKFTSFCQALKRCTQNKTGSFFSASRCSTVQSPTPVACGRNQAAVINVKRDINL